MQWSLLRISVLSRRVGAVGRAYDSHARGRMFESRQRQIKVETVRLPSAYHHWSGVNFTSPQKSQKRMSHHPCHCNTIKNPHRSKDMTLRPWLSSIRSWMGSPQSRQWWRPPYELKILFKEKKKTTTTNSVDTVKPTESLVFLFNYHTYMVFWQIRSARKQTLLVLTNYWPRMVYFNHIVMKNDWKTETQLYTQIKHSFSDRLFS